MTSTQAKMHKFTRIPEAQFITRVELHQGSSEDYVRLHKKMGDFGFSQEIVSSDNVTYRLPTAEYYYFGSVLISDLLELAEQAASAVGKAASVLVTEAAGISGSGLEPT